MLNRPKPAPAGTRPAPLGALLLGLILTGGVPHTASAVPTVGSVNLPLDPPDATVNTLDMGLSAVGTVPTDFFPVNINASDSDTSTVSGSLLCDFDLEINPTTLAAELQSISFKGSPIYLDNDPAFNLNLGFLLGSVAVDGKDLVASANTPGDPGTVTGTGFPLAPHELRLYQGTISGIASGTAAEFIDPFNINLTETPLVGPLGAGDGAVTISAPSQNGSLVSYDIVVTIPADFSSLVLDDPVAVTVTTAGMIRASGILTIDLDADLLPPGPIEIISVVANNPAADDVTITWDSNGGAATYRVLSTLDPSDPISSWTVENPSVPNGGAMTPFTDAGVLETEGTKFYLIEEN